MAQPPPVPPGQCRWGSGGGGHFVACNFDQAEKTLLQASLPYLFGLDLLFLLLGLVLCAVGARALAWLPTKMSGPVARRGTMIRLGGVAICIMAVGQLVSTAELNESIGGGHPAPIGMAIVMVGLLMVLVVLVRAKLIA